MTKVHRQSNSGIELRFVTVSDSARPFASSHVLTIRKGGDQRFNVGPEFFPVLTAAVQKIEDDRARRGEIPLCGSLILMCEPPKYTIGDGKGVPYTFPSLEDLKTFVSDIEQLHFALPSAGAKTEKPNG